MKADDLMRGDWVAGVTFQGNRIVSKVKAIGYRNDLLCLPIVVLDTYDGRGVVFDEKDIEPITLNDYWLNKLGFKVVQGSDLYHLECFHLGYACKIGYELGSKTLFVNGGFIPEPICNVHQLQNILTDCGLKDELRLW